MRKIKNIVILLLVLIMLGSNRVYGQNKNDASFMPCNIYAGYGIGLTTEQLTITSEEALFADPMDKGYGLKYNTNNWHLGIEWVARNGVRFTFVYNRRQGTYNKAGSWSDIDEDRLLLDENDIKDITISTFRFCAGPCIRPGHRFHIPVLFGFGFDEYKDGLLSYFEQTYVMTGSLTIRPTLYIANRLALFVDVTGDVGFPRSGNFLSSSTLNMAPNDPGNIRHAHFEVQLMAGLSFTLTTKQVIKD